MGWAKVQIGAIPRNKRVINRQTGRRPFRLALGKAMDLVEGRGASQQSGSVVVISVMLVS